MEVPAAQLTIQIVVVRNQHRVKGELLSIDVFEIVRILLFDRTLQVTNGLVILE